MMNFLIVVTLVSFMAAGVFLWRLYNEYIRENTPDASEIAKDADGFFAG